MRSPLARSIADGWAVMCSRRLYICAMILVPLAVCVFFVSLLSEGLPVRVPTALVDLDHTEMSRAMTRRLASDQLINITDECESYDQALAAVRTGRVFGFYMIPANFQRDALSGRKPTLTYYSNMTYFVPGTFSYKGYKSIATVTAAGMVMSMAEASGMPAQMVEALVKPVSIDINPLNNPWADYSIYLSPSFMAGLLQLMIMLVTAMSITLEIKHGTSRRWLAIARGSIITAVTGKLLPQAVVWTVVGWCVQAILYGYAGFPLNGSLWVMIAAMPLFVLACQGLGLFITCVLPNPRMAMSICALVAMLAFSFTGFSYPVQSMYGALAVFSYIVPVRYYFLITANTALNGLPLYYSRICFAVMICFTLLPFTMLWHLKGACRKQVYVK